MDGNTLTLSIGVTVAEDSPSASEAINYESLNTIPAKELSELFDDIVHTRLYLYNLMARFKKWENALNKSMQVKKAEQASVKTKEDGLPCLFG